MQAILLNKLNEEFVMKVYASKTEGPRRVRPIVRWKDRVKECKHESR